MLQQLGCHFCTKGCQNPRARGSQGAATGDWAETIALKTCDPATRRTSGPVSPKPPSPPATRRVTQKWTPRDGLLPLQDPPQPAEGALEVLALRTLPQGERPAELCEVLRSSFLYCGLCRFYFSRITHAVATTALVGIVDSGMLFFLPMISRD